MKKSLSSKILIALTLSPFMLTPIFLKADLSLDCESGNRAVEIANCWGFGAISYTNTTSFVISGIWSTRSNQLTNPSPTSCWIKTPWFKPASGNITFRVRLEATNGTTRGVALTYIAYDPAQPSKEGDTLLFETIYLPTPFNTNIHDISTAMPAEIADSDEIYKIRVSFIGTGGNSRMIGDDFVFPGLYWSDPSTGCIALPLPNMWTGTIDRQWELDGNWSRNHIPLPHHDVSIPPVPNQPIISSDVLINRLNIETGSNVTIAFNGKLTVNNDMVNANGPEGLHVKSNLYGTGSLIYNDQDVYGTIETYLPAAGYHLASVPLTQASNPMSVLFLWSYLYEYDVPGQKWVGLGSPTNTPLFADKGYMIWKYPGPASWQPDTTYSFAGQLNNGTFPYNITFPDFQGNHNLVGNPYPSPIDWNAGGGWTKMDVSGSYWMWIHSSNNYGVWNGIVGTQGVTKDIPVGQGFFVQALSVNPVLEVNNNARTHSDQAFYKDKEEIENILRIKALANNYSDEIIILFNELSTPGFDSWSDATKMSGLAGAPQLYTIIDDDTRLTINTIPYSRSIIEIPLAFTMSVAGEVVFEASSIESFEPQASIQLLDVHAGIITDLRTHSNYTFLHNPENDPVRFKLIFNGLTAVPEPSIPAVELFFSNNYIHLRIPENIPQATPVYFYDASGRIIFRTKVKPSYSTFMLPHVKSGIYIAHLVFDDKPVVKKILIK